MYDEQHPFAPENDPDGSRRLKVIAGVDLLLMKLGRKYFPHRRDEGDRDEAVNTARWRLYDYSLPRFDNYTGTTVLSYILLTAKRCLIDSSKGRIRRLVGAHRVPIEDSEPPTSALAQDRTYDRAIEGFAEQVLAEPEKFLPVDQARSFRKIVIEGQSSATLSRCPADGSAKLGRLRKRVVRVAIEMGIIA